MLSHPFEDPPPPDASAVPYPEIYNDLLALILKDASQDGQYLIVFPNIYAGFGPFDQESVVETITDKCNISSSEIAPVVSQYGEIHKKYKFLTLESSLQDGYFIDYERFFGTITWVNHNWDEVRKDYPQMGNLVSVSLPAYDPDTGYVLVYLRQSQYSAFDWVGGLDVILYKYTDGKLEKVCSTWPYY